MTKVTESRFIKQIKHGDNNFKDVVTGRFRALGCLRQEVFDDIKPNNLTQLRNSITSIPKYKTKYGELFNVLKASNCQIYTMMDCYTDIVYYLDLNDIR